MERRELLAAGFRNLVRTLPEWLAAAGGLGLLLSRETGAPTVGPGASCFPREIAGQPDQTPPPLNEEE